jgi:hypothetical protein
VLQVEDLLLWGGVTIFKLKSNVRAQKTSLLSIIFFTKLRTFNNTVFTPVIHGVQSSVRVGSVQYSQISPVVFNIYHIAYMYIFKA